MKNQIVSVSFMLMGILFCVCLIAANLLEAKVVQVGALSITAGFIVFPVSYIINDCIAEVWGFRKARLIIWAGFAMNFFFILLAKVAVALPAAPFWEGEEHFDFVFGLAPRIALASLAAFLAGSFINAYVMSRMKIASQGRHFSLRLLPVDELLKMMAVQALAKTLYEVLVLPVTVRVVRYVKRVDGSDVYDTDVSYNILKLKQL